MLQTARYIKTEVQRETRKQKKSITEKTKEKWHGKRMHGQRPRSLDEKLMDIEQLYRCLKYGDLKEETGITIVAAQDQTISKDINMNCGLEKCVSICLKRGRVQSKMQIENTLENDIKELDPRKAYKYLGIEENFDIQHKIEKEKLKKEYLRRLILGLGTELNAKNKIQAIGSLAVPVIRYSFGIINWNQEELQKLNRKTRKLLNIHGQHHPKAEVDCLYVPRNYGGRGLMQLEAAYAVEIINLAEYIDRKKTH
jgi:hypothetical protein